MNRSLLFHRLRDLCACLLWLLWQLGFGQFAYSSFGVQVPMTVPILNSWTLRRIAWLFTSLWQLKLAITCPALQTPLITWEISEQKVFLDKAYKIMKITMFSDIERYSFFSLKEFFKFLHCEIVLRKRIARVRWCTPWALITRAWIPIFGLKAGQRSTGQHLYTIISHRLSSCINLSCIMYHHVSWFIIGYHPLSEFVIVYHHYHHS